MRKQFLIAALLISANLSMNAQNYSAKFNGTGDTGLLVSNTGLTDNEHTFTVDCWIKRNAVNNGIQFIMQDSNLVAIYLEHDSICAYLGDGYSSYPICFFVKKTLPFDNNWHHIAVSFLHQFAPASIPNFYFNLYVDNDSVINSLTQYIGSLNVWYISNGINFMATQMTIGAGELNIVPIPGYPQYSELLLDSLVTTSSVFNGDIYRLTIYNSRFSNYTDTCSIPANYLWSFFSQNVDSAYYKNDSSATFVGNIKTYNSPCNDTVITTKVSLNEIENSISISPNPANNIVFVNCPVLIEKVELLNLLGQVFFVERANKNKLQIDVSGLNNGMYILKINDNFIKKIIKN